MSFTGLLNEEMIVRSRTIGADSYGGQTVSYTTIHSAKPCRIDCLSNEQQALLSRSGILATHKFFCEGDATVSVENELIVGSTTYRVVSVVDIGAMPAGVHHYTILTRTPS